MMPDLFDIPIEPRAPLTAALEIAIAKIAHNLLDIWSTVRCVDAEGWEFAPDRGWFTQYDIASVYFGVYGQRTSTDTIGATLRDLRKKRYIESQRFEGHSKGLMLYRYKL